MILLWGLLSVILAVQFYIFAEKMRDIKPETATIPMVNAKYGYPIFYCISIVMALQALPKFIYVASTTSEAVVPGWALGANLAAHIAMIYIMWRAQKWTIFNA